MFKLENLPANISSLSLLSTFVEICPIIGPSSTPALTR